MSLADKQAEKKQQAINVAPIIYHYKWIAATVGIDEKTLENWRKADTEFSDGLNQARAEFIKTNMRKSRPDFLLETADRKVFGKNVDITSGGEPLSVNVINYAEHNDPV